MGRMRGHAAREGRGKSEWTEMIPFATVRRPLAGRARLGAVCCALAVMISASEVRAQTGTIWSFLGVGAAQNSSDPAIAAAAKAKAAKHKICKKKKSLQYLSGLGCTPERPEVAEAILAAMSDPDEPVRYEAVKAVLMTAGDCMSAEQKKAMRKALGCHEACKMAKLKFDQAMHKCLDRLCGKAPPKEHKKLSELCSHCNLFGGEDCPDPTKTEPKDCGKRRGTCCTPEIRAKLQELAFGRDENGCFLERSTRVRTAAEQALTACNACAGGACQPGAGVMTGWREMPPEEQRELGPTADDRGGWGQPADSFCRPLPPPGGSPHPTWALPTPAAASPQPAGACPDCQPGADVQFDPPLVLPEETILTPDASRHGLPPAEPIPAPSAWVPPAWQLRLAIEPPRSPPPPVGRRPPTPAETFTPKPGEMPWMLRGGPSW